MSEGQTPAGRRPARKAKPAAVPAAAMAPEAARPGPAATKTTPAETAAPEAPAAEGVTMAAEAPAPGPAPETATRPATVTNQRLPTATTRMEHIMSQTTKATEGVYKAAEEAAEFSRGNLEAFTKATQIYVAGLQDLSKQTMAMMQGLTEHAIEGAKALAAVKNLKDATDIQTNYTRAAMEKTLSEGAKLQEASLKLVETTMAPITARMTLAVEKVSKPIAA